MKIAFLDRETFIETVTLKPVASPHQWVNYVGTDASNLLQRALGVAVLVNNKVTLNAELLAQLPDLKMIAVTATGYDCVDIDYCKKNNIVVSNVTGYAKHTVAEHALALMLSLRRNILAYHQQVQAHEWEKSKQFCLFTYPLQDLVNTRLVLVGSGSLGQGTAHLARAFGMDVKFAARKDQTEAITPAQAANNVISWNEALHTADILSLHCPLNAQTRGLIARPEFKQMKANALLINTARGGLVHENDLVEALENSEISGAGFDVAEHEPLHSDSPLKKLYGRTDFILTPHVAWASAQAQQALLDHTIDNINAFLSGAPRNCVS